MGANDKPDEKKPPQECADDKMKEGLTEEWYEMDEDAPTVIMQRAIDPALFTAKKKPNPEETHVIQAGKTGDSKQMTEEELNRIVDEVGKFGAMPLDRLPSEVDKDKSDDGKQSS